mmetsp:Transcript_5854/g.14912  ORF Transcript_5854/g.14912 Transcript_5854/m.14912 type:complete len:277 (+) Transcript_5854:1267-2097(+)
MRLEVQLECHFHCMFGLLRSTHNLISTAKVLPAHGQLWMTITEDALSNIDRLKMQRDRSSMLAELVVDQCQIMKDARDECVIVAEKGSTDSQCLLEERACLVRVRVELDLAEAAEATRHFEIVLSQQSGVQLHGGDDVCFGLCPATLVPVQLSNQVVGLGQLGAVRVGTLGQFERHLQEAAGALVLLETAEEAANFLEECKLGGWHSTAAADSSVVGLQQNAHILIGCSGRRVGDMILDPLPVVLELMASLASVQVEKHLWLSENALEKVEAVRCQ